jgi:hypothetical protein
MRCIFSSPFQETDFRRQCLWQWTNLKQRGREWCHKIRSSQSCVDEPKVLQTPCASVVVLWYAADWVYADSWQTGAGHVGPHLQLGRRQHIDCITCKSLKKICQLRSPAACAKWPWLRIGLRNGSESGGTVQRFNRVEDSLGDLHQEKYTHFSLVFLCLKKVKTS